MKYKAEFIAGRNTFFRLEVENHDDDADVVAEDMKALAKKMGVDFMYVTPLDDDGE